MHTIDPAATAWLLASTALVLLMTPGLAIFYGGMVRITGVLNMIMMSFVSIPLVTVAWLLVAYTIAFSEDGAGGLIGNFRHVGMLGIGPDTMPERTIIAKDPFPSPFLVISNEGDTGALRGAEQLVHLSVRDRLAAVIELLATTRTLGGVPVTDEAAEDAIGVLLNAHDWWHSPAIVPGP